MNIPLMTPLRIPNQLFFAKKFEVWSNGQKIDEGNESLELWVEQKSTETLEDSLQITVRKRDRTKGDIHKYINERFYLDVAYALNDRVLVCIIPETSNISNYNTFDTFISFAPFITRKHCDFKTKEPFCCSLFYDDNNELIKVSYSNGINKTLIECT